MVPPSGRKILPNTVPQCACGWDCNWKFLTTAFRKQLHLSKHDSRPRNELKVGFTITFHNTHLKQTLQHPRKKWQNWPWPKAVYKVPGVVPGPQLWAEPPLISPINPWTLPGPLHCVVLRAHGSEQRQPPRVSLNPWQGVNGRSSYNY